MGRDLTGLSSEEAKKLLEKHGKNALPEMPPPSSLKIFLAQLKSPLVYVLILAGVVTFFLHEYTDTVIISLAVFLNTVLGFMQEKKASQALEALKGMLHPEAVAIRDGKRLKILVENIVPGDVVVLPHGEKIPADGVILEASHMFVEEAILTGESSPVAKKKDSEVFMGTIVTAGQGFMKVALTGEETKMGGIALSVQKAGEDTPLKKQLTSFSKQLSILVLVLTLIVFVVGLISGRDLSEIFLTSVALAVSAIPEGLLVALTVILAIGMQRILKKKGLVRNLVSAETLGGVTTICVDKTGTLTEGKMKAVRLVGDKKELAKQALLSNDQDDPIVIAAYKWATRELVSLDLKGEKIDSYIDKHRRLDSLPFSSEDRFAATLHHWRGNKNILFVNGAPDFLLEWCNIGKDEKEEIIEVIEELTGKGMRLIGMARKELPDKTKIINKKLVQSKLQWVGILAFSDPVRGGISEAFKKAKKAGIRTIVITGDYPQTALSVTQEIGLSVDKQKVILGDELDEMSENGLAKVLLTREPMLFARTTPNQKLKIVNSLKDNGEVVAMTGDGVNDAPALAAADIGIAVAEATDVTKESADLVLLDSSFNTIVTAVEEGRGIFDNIRKVILYLLSDAFSEVVAVLGAILLLLPLPVTATQILWINLVSDGFPNLALTIDPKRKHAMNEPPRDPRIPLVNSWMVAIIAMVSIFSGLTALGLFWYVNNATNNEILARSVAFATLGINSLVYVFSVRALREPIWKVNPTNNKWLILGVFGGVVLQVMPFVFPPAKMFFNVESIPLNYWGLIAIFTFIMLLLIEVSKVTFKEALKKR
jgi:Ca2+-transporting ATPase